MREAIFTILAFLFPACPTEDSIRCAWDAEAQGNGTGASFIALTETIIIYEASK